MNTRNPNDTPRDTTPSDLIVFTHVEIRRRVGDNFQILSNHSNSIDCETWNDAETVYQSLDSTLMEEVKNQKSQLHRASTAR